MTTSHAVGAGDATVGPNRILSAGLPGVDALRHDVEPGTEEDF